MVAFVSLQCLLGILCGINLAVVFAPWRETLVALIVIIIIIKSLLLKNY